jgi:hypothetical protein
MSLTITIKEAQVPRHEPIITSPRVISPDNGLPAQSLLILRDDAQE